MAKFSPKVLQRHLYKKIGKQLLASMLADGDGWTQGRVRTYAQVSRAQNIAMQHQLNMQFCNMNLWFMNNMNVVCLHWIPILTFKTDQLILCKPMASLVHMDA